MKFSWGKWANRRYRAKKLKEEKLSYWYKWFAWHPVKICEEDWRWLEYVMRRKYSFECEVDRGFFYPIMITEIAYIWEYKPYNKETK